jgi:PGF-pre-PGF domain-containing protein
LSEKRGRVLLVGGPVLFLLVLSLVLFQVTTVLGQQLPLTPMFIEGTVTVGGSPADTTYVVQGYVVQATAAPSSGWQLCTVGRASDGRFGAVNTDSTLVCPQTAKQHLKIPQDDSTTSAQDGGVKGDTVVFGVGRMVNRGIGSEFVGRLGTIPSTISYEGGTNPGPVSISVTNAQVLAITGYSVSASNLVITASGTVKDLAGTAIASARVYTDWGDGSDVAEVVSGSDGTFSHQHTYSSAGAKTAVSAAVKSDFVPVNATASATATAATTTTTTSSGGAAFAPIKATDVDDLLSGIGTGAQSVASVADSIRDGLTSGGTTEANVGLSFQDGLTNGTVEASTIAGILERIGSESVSLILDSMTVATVIDVFQVMAAAKAADVLAYVTETRAIEIVQGLTAAKGAAILELLTKELAGAILTGVDVDKRTAFVQEMTVESLILNLPEVTPEALFAIAPEVLFAKLPSVPVEQLILEIAPTVDPSLAAPVSVKISSTKTRYELADTGQGVWASLVASPKPIDRILAKFGDKFANLKVEVESLSGLPAGAPSLPSGSIVSDYFSVDLVDVPKEKVLQGHITFYVEKDWVTTNSIHKWAVFLYKQDEDSNAWITVPTKRVREDETRIYYSAPVPNFSNFAVAGGTEIPSAQFEVTGLNLPTDAGGGAEFEVSAQVRNLTGIAQTYMGNLWLDNLVRATKSIAVPAGGTEKLTLGATVSTGNYSVRVERLMNTILVGDIAPKPTPAPQVTPVPTAPKPTPVPTTAPKPTPVPIATPMPIATPAATAVVPKPTAVVPIPTAAPPTATAVQPTPATPAPSPVVEPPEDTGTPLGLIIMIVLGVLAIAGVGAFIAMRRGRG